MTTPAWLPAPLSMSGNGHVVPPPPGGAGQAPPEFPASRPVPWGLGDAIAVFILSFLLAVGAGIALGGLLPADVSESVGDALLGPLTLIVLGLTTVGWVAVRYRGAVRMLVGARPRVRDVLVAFGIGIAAVLVITAGLGLALGLLLELFGEEIPTVQQTLRDAARDPQTAPILAVSALVAAPIFEELFFRGMVFPALAKRLGLWGGIVVSAAVFGLVHLNQAENTVGAILLLVRLVPLGILFAWLYHWRGTIVVPIIVHSVFNAASVALLLAGIE